MMGGCTTAKLKPSPYRLQMVSQLQVEGPCIASLVGSPAASCIQWEPNVTAFATYEPSRRLIFCGAADNLLHISDADSGKPLAKVVTAGRVVTKIAFGKNRALMYFGTEKGKLYGLDAYSFEPIFTLNADGKINNNITLVDNTVVFTSAIGTVYGVDATTGFIKWQVAQPLQKERLRFAQQSNLVVMNDEPTKSTLVIVPHSDGYLSAIDAESGKVRRRLDLGIAQGNGFPDVVAPMVLMKNRLWVASHDFGIAIVDLTSFRIREQITLSGVLELATDGSAVYAATADAVFRLRENGEIAWKNDIATVKSRIPRAGFAFDKFSQGSKRMFYGVPTRILVDENHLMLSYSLGSIGIFDKGSGHVSAILGNSIGFSALEWAGPFSFMAVSKRGLLMKFEAY